MGRRGEEKFYLTSKTKQVGFEFGSQTLGHLLHEDKICESCGNSALCQEDYLAAC